MKKNNMPLTIEELSKMNAFEVLWNCSKDHLNDVALTYSADFMVDNIKKRPLLKKITYRELISNILKTYKALKENGVKLGDVITFSSITTPELIYTAYASILLGSVFKPIDVRFNSKDLIEQFSATNSKLFFCSEPFLDKIMPIYGDIGVNKIVVMNFTESLPKVVQIASKIQKVKNKERTVINNKIFTDWKHLISGYSAGNIPTKNVGKDEIIHITSTTGTTGAPKMLLHNSSNWNAQLYNASYSDLDLKRGDTFFNCTVPWVDFGIINAIHTFLCNGVVMNLDPLWKAEKNADYIVKNNPNWWMGGPGWLDELFCNEKYDNANLSNAKCYITGGAPLYPHKHMIYQAKLTKMSEQGKIVPGYGYSEVSAAASIDIQNKPGTIGEMWPLVNAEIRDKDTGVTLSEGEEGELWISSKSSELTQVSPGYYNNEQKNRETFVLDSNGVRWAKSGDKVRKNADGTYTWLSRYKNILTYNGFNIDCEKIIDKLEQMNEVSKCAVFGAITGDGNQMPVICIEIKDNINITNEELEIKVFKLIVSIEKVNCS